MHGLIVLNTMCSGLGRSSIAMMVFSFLQDVDALVEALVAVVRPDEGALRATSATTLATDKIKSEEGSAEKKRNARERVVLLMHETRVLDASDATRVLLLLARQV